MKVSDTIAGLLIVLFGMAVALYARTFPPMPGQPVGPALFPTVIGVGLVLFGAVLAVTGARRREGPLLEREGWTRKPRMVLHFVLTIGVLLFYSLVVDRLGFHVTAILFLSVLFVAFEVRRRWIAPVAIAVAALIHYGFYSLLRVPLPWGVLEAIAW